MAPLSNKLGALVKLNGSAAKVIALVPGVVTSGVCVIGIIVLNILQHHYLSIPFAVGALAGLCSIYQGYQSHLLKSFQESNQQLQSSITTLNQSNNALQQTSADIKSENQRLNSQITDLKNTNTALKEQHEQLRLLNIEHRANITDLEATKKELQETSRNNLTRLTALNDSLGAIQQATETDHTQFATHIKTFISEVHTLQQSTPQLLQTAQHLHAIFTKIHQWTDSEFIAQQVALQKQLTSDLAKLEEQIQVNRLLCTKKGRQLEDLNNIKNQLHNELEKLRIERQSFTTKLTNENSVHNYKDIKIITFNNIIQEKTSA